MRGEATRARITEPTESGTVPFLKVANETDRPLLLLDGEELLGAKQNRILNTTALAAAHTEVTIPVSCVEQGRWGYRGRRLRPGDASPDASLRAREAAWVSQSIRAGRGGTGPTKAPCGSTSPAGPRGPGRPAGQVGALIYIGTQWVGLDLLAGLGLCGYRGA